MADKTKILVSAATVTIGGVNIGFTTGGVAITPSRDTVNIEADQSDFPLFIKTTGRSVTIAMKLMEVTPENLKLAWGEPANVVGDSIKIGAPEQSPIEKEIVITGTRMDGKQVKYTFYSCIVSGNGAFEFQKNAAGVLDVTFTATYDPTNDAIGKMEIVT